MVSSADSVVQIYQVSEAEVEPGRLVFKLKPEVPERLPALVEKEMVQNSSMQVVATEDISKVIQEENILIV